MMIKSMDTNAQQETHTIQELNDRFRQSLRGGKVMLSAGVAALGETAVNEILALVRSYDDFTPDNDPYGEHDFGKMLYQGQSLFWKIDYYDKSLKYGSNNPADPAQTVRVITVMIADEY